jgi:hypothetical protein
MKHIAISLEWTSQTDTTTLQAILP